MDRGTGWGQRDETGQKDRCTRTGIERMGHGQKDRDRGIGTERQGERDRTGAERQRHASIWGLMTPYLMEDDTPSWSIFSKHSIYT